MAAWMVDSPGLPVLSLKRPRHEVDHVHFAIHNDGMLVVAQESSKTFICYSLLCEFSRRHKKWAVLLTDINDSELGIKQLIKTLIQFLPNKPISFFNNQSVQSLPSLQSLIPGEQRNQNVLVTSSNYLLHCFAKSDLQPNDISLLILNTCDPVNTALGKECPYKQILDVLSKEITRPRIVGLMHLELADISNALDLNAQIDHVESVYSLPVHLSRDLLAMNNYGEEIAVESIMYDTKPCSSTAADVCNLLKNVSEFLCDINITESSKSFEKLKAIIALSVDVLTTFGLWSLQFNLETMQNMFTNLEAKESDSMIILAIQSCRSQFEVLQELLNTAFKTMSSDGHSQLIYKICDILIPYKVYCNTSVRHQPSDLESVADPTNEQKPCSTDECQAEGTTDCPTADSLPSETKTTLGMRLVKLQTKDQFRCVIVAKSNSFAKMLSKLINYLSSCDEKYSFLKCGCITQSERPEADMTKNVLHAILQGVINVVVMTVDLFSDLLVTSCNVLVYFGVPNSYERYFNLKQKTRAHAPKLVLVFPREQLVNSKRNLKVFKDMEEQIEKKVPGYISLARKDTLLKYLANDLSRCYAPFGEDGPSVSMDSSIHIVNRYCRKISRGDFAGLHAQFITCMTIVSENTIEVVSDLYLPLGSPCQDAIQGRPVRVTVGNELELAVGILKSKMEASLECVKELHASGNIDDDLDLTEEQFIDPSNTEVKNCELEDEGKGRAGTNKRKRAYAIKVPSFFENNMPVADEPLYLHKIELGHSKIYSYCKPDVLQQHSDPEFELGILSRKQLPRTPTFILYTADRELTVSIVATGSCPLRLEHDDIRCIKHFHQYIFKDLLKFSSQSSLSEHDGYLVVPLLPGSTNNAQIHFSFLKQFEVSERDANGNPQSAKPIKDFSIFENKIVRRLNQSAVEVRYTKYFVVRVCEDLHPSSAFPDPDVAATFADYYRNRYGIEVSLEQPLLSVQYLPSTLNFLFPRHRQLESNSKETAAKKERPTRTELHLIPELCLILPLSTSAWTLVRYIPTIVYRLSTLLLAHELKCRIQEGTGVGCKPWPSEVLLPGLGTGDSVGEERLDHGDQLPEFGKSDSVGEERFGSGDYSPEFGTSDNVSRGKLNNGNHLPTHGAVDSVGKERIDKTFDESTVHNHCYENYITSTSFNGDQPSGTNVHALPTPTTGPDIGPCVTLMLRALTAKSAGQYFHSERLEVLGDSLLKLEVSVELYLTHREKDEWALSICRGHLVSNDMLSMHGRRLGLPGYMATTLPDITKNSLPPGLTFAGQGPKTASPDGTDVSELNTYRHQVLGDKHVANCVEALIGAYLVSCGRSSARRLLVWLGIVKRTFEDLEALFDSPNSSSNDSQYASSDSQNVAGNDKQNSAGNDSQNFPSNDSQNFPSNDKQNFAGNGSQNTANNDSQKSANNDSQNSASNDKNTARNHSQKPANNDSPHSSKMIYQLGEIQSTRSLPFYDMPESCQLNELAPIEDEIGYCFKNKYLLLQALTHTSYSTSLTLVSESYQRLEFLGDAVLDYLVTMHLFARFSQLNHGDITDFRSALVNNFTVAFLAVKNRLHQFLRCMSPPLIDVIGQFVEHLEEQEAKQGASWKTSVDAFVVGNTEVDESSIEVPKVLGDIFEALVCAVFLDCRMDLDVVWNVVYPMLQPFIDYYKDNIPRSPVRTLQETFPDQVSFSLARLTLAKKYTCSVCVVGYGTFNATGRTPKIAKASVARKALQHLHNISVLN